MGLCASLVATSVGVTHFLENRNGKSNAAEPSAAVAAPAGATSKSADSPWGTLVTMDVDIQQPEEYVAFDTTADSGSTT